MKAPNQTAESIKAYLQELYDNSLLYHMDDPISEICWSTEPTEEQLAVMLEAEQVIDSFRSDEANIDIFELYPTEAFGE